MDLLKGYASNSNSSQEADFVGRSGVADERETDMMAVTSGEHIYFPRSNCYVGAKKTFQLVADALQSRFWWKMNVFGSKETIFSHLPRVTTKNHKIIIKR